MIVQNCIIITLVLVTGVHCVCLFDHGIRFRMNTEATLQRNMLFYVQVFFFLKQHASGLNLTCLCIIPTLPIGLTPGIGISFDSKHPT